MGTHTLRKYEARNMGHDEACVTVTKPGPHCVSTPVVWSEESGSSLPHCSYTRLGLLAFRVDCDARLCSFFHKTLHNECSNDNNNNYANCMKTNS